MRYHISKTQNITVAMRKLKLALGLSLLDHWEWTLDHTETHYIVDVHGKMPTTLSEPDMMVWKLTYS